MVETEKQLLENGRSLSSLISTSEERDVQVLNPFRNFFSGFKVWDLGNLGPLSWTVRV